MTGYPTDEKKDKNYMTEYKVGQKVKIISNSGINYYLAIGSIGEILYCDPPFVSIDGVNGDGQKINQGLSLQDIEPIEESKVLYVFREGDTIEMLDSCRNAFKGDRLIVGRGSKFASTNGEDINSCHHPEKWKLIKETPTQTESMERKESEKKMQSTFKEGDKIRQITGCRDAVKGGIYTVEFDKYEASPHKLVVANKNNRGCHCDNERYWELIEESVPAKSVMQKLNILAKKFLDPETKALVKAGVLDNCLNVTEEGRKFIDAFIVDQFKAELAKEAKALLKEQKEEKEESK